MIAPAKNEQCSIGMVEICQKARVLGIEQTTEISRIDMIHEIQIKEGNRACYKTDVHGCQKIDCSYHYDCQITVAEMELNARIIRLRLQSVFLICEKTISKFYQVGISDENCQIIIDEDSDRCIFAWIDENLLDNILVMLFQSLYERMSKKKNIVISVGRIGQSVCRIVIACENEQKPLLCDGPYCASKIHWSGIEAAENIIKMHGGNFRIWKMRYQHEFFFEIDLLCINKEQEAFHDTY